MARTSENVTQQELNYCEKFFDDNNIVKEDAVGERNGNEFGTYLLQTWGVDITPATLAVALDKLRDRLVFYTPAQIQYRRIAAEDPAKAQKLSEWLATGQNFLIKDGDQGLENLSSLLIELRGYDVTSQTLHNAVARIGAPVSKFHPARRQLHLAPVIRQEREDPRRHKASDFTERPPANEQPWQRAKREREAREAEYAKLAARDASVTSDRAISDARAKAEAMLHGPDHAESEQLSRLLATKDGEVDWIGTLALRSAYRARLDKQRAIARRF